MKIRKNYFSSLFNQNIWYVVDNYTTINLKIKEIISWQFIKMTETRPKKCWQFYDILKIFDLKRNNHHISDISLALLYTVFKKNAMPG